MAVCYRRRQFNHVGSVSGFRGYDYASLSKLAQAKLAMMLRMHRFHEEIDVEGKKYRTWARNLINHPLPPIDKGNYTVDCTTDLVSYDPPDIAKMVLQVNDRVSHYNPPHLLQLL